MTEIGSLDNTFFADAEPTGAGTGIVFVGSGSPEVMALDLPHRLFRRPPQHHFQGGTTLRRFLANGAIDPTFTVTAG